MRVFGIGLLAFAGPLFAQNAEPAPLSGNIEAIPIDGFAPPANDLNAADEAANEQPPAEKAHSHDPVAATALRWKATRRAGGNWQTQPAAQPIAAEAQPIAAATQPIGSGVAAATAAPGWNITRVDLAVRPVQALRAADGSDPFNDPFGDRQQAVGERQAGTLELEPTAAESGIEELPAPVRSAAAPRSVVQRPTPVAEPSPPAYLEIAQPGNIPTPFDDAENLPAERSLPCDRIYNDRNCCDIEAGCVEFRNQLLSDTLKNISLDITPRFNPDLSLEEDEFERTAKLGAREVREWRNRLGQVVATGRMSNLANNAVVITDESGREVARIPWSQLANDEMCYINAWWRLPAECSLGGLQDVRRDWACSTFLWHASALCHKPLYFEDVQLERYGHTAGPFRQPFISGAHFFLNIAALPYNMGINPPHECQYALGYYRPGSCAPWMIEPIPLSLRGAAAETATVLGLIHLIP